MRHFRFAVRLVFILFTGLLLTQSAVHGQGLTVGIKGGVLLTDPMDQVDGSSEAKRYVVGPILEIRLPASFALEISALYRRTGFTSSDGAIFPATHHVRANSWEFPVLAKYYVSRRSVLARPYISGGYVPRFLSNVQDDVFGPDPIHGLPPYITYSQQYPLRANPSQGVAIGSGFSFKAGFIHIAPEIRYTHWSSLPFDEIGSRGFSLKSARHEWDFLIAATF